MSAEVAGSGQDVRRRRKIDGLFALLLMALTVGWMLSVEGRQGVGRDEGQYFRAAERYWGWFETLAHNLKAGQLGKSFTFAGVEPYWVTNHEHPVVMKVLYGFSWRLFHRCECVKEAGWHHIPVPFKHRTLPLFPRESTAFRFPAILLAGLGAALVFLLARRWVGRGPAVAAGVLSVAQPHYFFHAQIAAFDAPITIFAVAVGFCYWKALRSPRWAIITGLVFGVALGVKHNAWLMPAFLVGHYLWMRRHDLLGRPGPTGPRRRIPPVPLVFLSMAVLGPLVFFLHWPKLWVHPKHAEWYIQRHTQHEHYNFEYLGRNWNNPPKEWDRKLVRMTFPFVSTALTVPVTTLALAGMGGLLLVRRARRRGARDPLRVSDEMFSDGADATLLPDPLPADPPRGSWLRPAADVDRSPGAFLFVQIFGPLAVLAIPSTPIFGGVKHFMPAMPYLAIAAAVGLRWLIRTVSQAGAAFSQRARVQRALPAAVAALCCLPALLETRRSHPDGLSHYNLIAGGFTGGASIGMNRQFWGYAVLPMLPWIMANAPASHRTYWHDVFTDQLNSYLRDGRMTWIGDVGIGEQVVANSDLGLLIHERHFVLYEALLWEAYGTTRPAYVYTREGVPIVTAYKRPKPR